MTCPMFSNRVLRWSRQLHISLQEDSASSEAGQHQQLTRFTTHGLEVSSEAPVWILSPPVFMYTHTRNLANGRFLSGGR